MIFYGLPTRKTSSTSRKTGEKGETFETEGTLETEGTSQAGNRAILFGIDEEIPEDALKTCIELALTYHSIKHFPLLGQ